MHGLQSFLWNCSLCTLDMLPPMQAMWFQEVRLRRLADSRIPCIHVEMDQVVSSVAVLHVSVSRNILIAWCLDAPPHISQMPVEFD